MEKAASIGAEEGEDGETVYNMTPQVRKAHLY